MLRHRVARAGIGVLAETGSQAFWAMLLYNVLIALYLAYLGTDGYLGDLLLWPGVALLLVWTWCDGPDQPCKLRHAYH